MSTVNSSLVRVVVFVLLLIGAPRAVQADADAVVAGGGNAYIKELVGAILKRTEGPGAAKPRTLGGAPASRERLLLELISGENVEFVAVATKREWEEKLIPIRIPLRKGLQGYRLFFTRKQDLPILKGIHSLERLKALPIGSGSQWSTTAALEQAGFRVVTAQNRANLMKMLALGRFRIFGRGLDEIFHEYEASSRTYPDIVIDQHLALYAPTPNYLFVTPKRPDLAERLERGLRELIADGTFDRIFQKHFADDIARAKLHNRTIFKIPNPNTGPETPFGQKELWYQPAEFRPEHLRFGTQTEASAH